MTTILPHEEVEHLRETRVGDPNDKYPFTAKDWHHFAAAIESATVARLAERAGELPEVGYLGDDVSYGYDATDMRTHTASLAARVEVLTEALVMAQSYIHSRCGTPDPEDPYADQILIVIEQQMEDALNATAGNGAKEV